MTLHRHNELDDDDKDKEKYILDENKLNYLNVTANTCKSKSKRKTNVSQTGISRKMLR